MPIVPLFFTAGRHVIMTQISRLIMLDVRYMSRIMHYIPFIACYKLVKGNLTVFGSLYV